MIPASSSSLARSLPSVSVIRRWLISQSATTPQLTHLSNRSVLEIAGPDAQKFLKGLTSRDVENLGGGYSGILNASGRVLHTVFILPAKTSRVPTYYIIHDTAANHPAPLLDLLPPFKLRSKVRVRDVSSEWDVWSAFGGADHDKKPTRTFKLGSGGAAEAQWFWPNGLADIGPDEIGCWDLRAGFGPHSMGRKVLVTKGKIPLLATAFDQGSLDDYDTRRMVLGVPEGSEEIIPGVALPLESCMDIHGGVDFRKGCYLGQELTVRTYHTGATRKRILPITLQSSSLPSGHLAEPSEIFYQPPPSAASQKVRSAGKILALHDKVGLGLVRVEMAEKSCWVDGEDQDRGSLFINVDGKNVQIAVNRGEAYAAALT